MSNQKSKENQNTVVNKEDKKRYTSRTRVTALLAKILKEEYAKENPSTMDNKICLTEAEKETKRLEKEERKVKREKAKVKKALEREAIDKRKEEREVKALAKKTAKEKAKTTKIVKVAKDTVKATTKATKETREAAEPANQATVKKTKEEKLLEKEEFKIAHGCEKSYYRNKAQVISPVLKEWIIKNIDLENEISLQNNPEDYYWLISILLLRYMPEHGYGYLHINTYDYANIKKPFLYLLLDNFELKERHIRHIRCQRYSFPNNLAIEFQKLVYNEAKKDYASVKNLKIKLYKSNKKRINVTKKSNVIRLNVEAMEKDDRCAPYLAHWRIANKLDKNGYYHQELYVKEGETELRCYETCDFSYQTMPSVLKSIGFLPEEQMNIDMISAHPRIAAIFDEGYKEILESSFFLKNKAALKPIITPSLYGQKFWNTQKKLEAINESSSLGLSEAEIKSFIKQLYKANHSLAKKIGCDDKEVWKFFHREERKRMVVVENYLDTLGLNYINMHDGLVVDGKFDIEVVNSLFTDGTLFAEKPIWDGKERSKEDVPFWKHRYRNSKVKN